MPGGGVRRDRAPFPAGAARGASVLDGGGAAVARVLGGERVVAVRGSRPQPRAGRGAFGFVPARAAAAPAEARGEPAAGPPAGSATAGEETPRPPAAAAAILAVARGARGGAGPARAGSALAQRARR